MLHNYLKTGLFESLKLELKKFRTEDFRLIAETLLKLKNIDNTWLDPFFHILYFGIYEVLFIYRDSLKEVIILMKQSEVWK